MIEDKEKLFRKAYIDYKQLERFLSIDLGDSHDIEKAYNYIKDMSERNKTISFTNVDLDLGYFDFYYYDMLLTISTYNKREVCKLAESIIIYDRYDNDYEIDFNDLERKVFKI